MALIQRAIATIGRMVAPDAIKVGSKASKSRGIRTLCANVT
jgi:hypothetical protein